MTRSRAPGNSAAPPSNALFAIEAVIATIYYVALTIVVVQGAHRLALTRLYSLRGEARTPQLVGDDVPTVTVQLPMYNERYVAARLIEAAAALDWPRDRMQVQILDDSTDDTRGIVDAAAERARAEGVVVEVVRREDRVGYKAGALEHGLASATGEFIAVFDADFVPPRDFLRRTVGAFADESVGMVQARWEHLNRDFSLLTRAQAVLLDGHFVVEQTARSQSGRFFNFNGTAGLWRRQAIVDAGGWDHDTLTEDLDLSYRAQLAGWRFEYLTDVTAPAEIPAEIHAFRSQQHRWAKGAAECCLKLARRVTKAPLPARVRFEALVHLTANFAYPLLIVLAVTMPLMARIRQHPGYEWATPLDLTLFSIGFGSVAAFYVAAQRRVGISLVRALAMVPVVLAVDIGLAVHKSRAVFEALVGHRTAFVRTPKMALVKRGQRWTSNAYLRGSLVAGLPELIIAAWCLSGAGAMLFGRYIDPWPLPFLLLFAGGFGYVGALSVAHAIPRLRSRPSSAPASLAP